MPVLVRLLITVIALISMNVLPMVPMIATSMHCAQIQLVVTHVNVILDILVMVKLAMMSMNVLI